LAVRTPRVESLAIVAVQTHVEHLAAVVEDILCAVTVVDIPVKDQHSLALVGSVPCSHCYVIDVAESGDILAVCMVPWGTHDAIATIVTSI